MCAIRNGDCEQICSSAHGVRQCSCHAGYTLKTDQKTCTGKLMKHGNCVCIRFIVTFDITTYIEVQFFHRSQLKYHGSFIIFSYQQEKRLQG